MKVVAWDEKHGRMLLRIEGQDDLWCLYNVLKVGDIVTSKTLREVKVGDKSSRKPMTLKIRVEKVEYQPFTERLRIRGIVIEGPEEFGVVGSYHTITVGEGSEILIEKEYWPKHELNRILKATSKKLCDILLIGVDSDEAALVIPHDYGLELIAEIQLALPGKHDLSKREEVIKSTIRELTEKAKELIDRFGIRAAVVVGPGFIKEDLAKEIASSTNIKIYTEPASTGGLQGIKEAIKRGALKRVLKDFSIIEEAELIDEFLSRVSKNDGKAVYGLEDVKRASEYCAVDKLLVLDELIRSSDLELRSEVEKVIEKAEKCGARVKIFSVFEEPGQQLKSLGGLAAILRFRIEDFE
ncbi:MAG: mRNA surveillance protein pelota [Candidatus Nezhaarchaeales archaeon]